VLLQRFNVVLLHDSLSASDRTPAYGLVICIYRG